MWFSFCTLLRLWAWALISERGWVFQCFWRQWPIREHMVSTSLHGGVYFYASDQMAHTDSHILNWSHQKLDLQHRIICVQVISVRAEMFPGGPTVHPHRPKSVRQDRHVACRPTEPQWGVLWGWPCDSHRVAGGPGWSCITHGLRAYGATAGWSLQGG